ncbi:MAG: prolipoprotein diacylglyceryl transferase family protein, partial [Pseudobdellovibrionaceae bacterium]
MIQWAPNPDLISVGPIHIRWYSLMFIVLFSVGYWLMQWMATRENKPQEKFETGFIYVFLGTLLGARLGHCLFYEPDYYFAHPLEIF